MVLEPTPLSCRSQQAPALMVGGQQALEALE